MDKKQKPTDEANPDVTLKPEDGAEIDFHKLEDLEEDDKRDREFWENSLDSPFNVDLEDIEE